MLAIFRIWIFALLFASSYSSINDEQKSALDIYRLEDGVWRTFTLNLTAADTVIHYDPWWNPAVEDQATDRAHRIGQDKTVFVYKFVTKGTVEEKILEMQQNKRALMEGLFSGNTSGKLKLTEKDLRGFFEPLETAT